MRALRPLLPSLPEPVPFRTAPAMPHEGQLAPFVTLRARTQTDDAPALSFRQQLDCKRGRRGLWCGGRLLPPATSTQPHPCGRASSSDRPKTSPVPPLVFQSLSHDPPVMGGSCGRATSSAARISLIACTASSNTVTLMLVACPLINRILSMAMPTVVSLATRFAFL
jgi:hypothetical protein